MLNQKYGIPAGRLRSYIDSYHGLKSKAGNVRVANCASCHGAHRILPHTDPTSSIHVDNLRDTCGECHPGISEELAASAIHETANGTKTGLPHMVSVAYLWLIGVTIGVMLLHNSADLARYLRNMRKRPYIIRLTLTETLQHWVLALAFIALVVSGFSLRFSEAWWVQILFGWGDGQGFLIRGNVHRSAAVIFALSGVWHGIYLFSHRGLGLLRDIAPGRSDLVNMLENLAYSQVLAKFGYVGGVGAKPIDAPGHNLTGDPYFTDGYRAVLWVSSMPVDINDIKVVQWRQPPD